MRKILISGALALAGATHAAPVVYMDEALYLMDLAALPGSTVHESFEDATAWADSRNSIVSPGSTAAVTREGITWTSNTPPNEIATGTVGGSAPDGAFAIYSLPHGETTDSGLYCDSAEDPNIPIECFQNDGLTVEAEAGGQLFAFGGRIDTANSGKVTFLLDGVDVNGNDTDNIDNWQREGDWADHWAFVGVIDSEGFASAELRELRGKALIKADIGVRVVSVSLGGWDHHSNELARLNGVAGDLSATLAAFHADLGPATSRTLTLAMTEFGRTAAENGSAGTDHGHGSVMLALGGGVQGGQVLTAGGQWPGLAPEDLFEGRDLAVTTDFRDVFSEVLDRHMGLDNLVPVFPGFQPSHTAYPGIPL